MSIFDGISTAINALKGLIGSVVKNPNEAAQLQAKIAELEAHIVEAQVAAEQALADAQAKVIVAEAESSSAIARNWRPVLMLTFGALIVYGILFKVAMPEQLWTMMTYGVTGYIGGRSAEKIVGQFLSRKQNNGG